jgi:hypothetical protein
MEGTFYNEREPYTTTKFGVYYKNGIKITGNWDNERLSGNCKIQK